MNPFGIDVSKWQASQDGLKRMDWNKAKAAGIEFAFCRATRGADYVDPQFFYNCSELRRLGIPHGAYHYFRPLEPMSQIQFFVDVVEPDQGELIVLDLENSADLPRAELTKRVVLAVEKIYALSGKYPIIYSRAEWLNSNIDMSRLPKLDYWLAQYLGARWFPLFTPEYDTAFMAIPRGITREQVKFHQTGEKGNGKKYGAQSYYIDTNRFIGTVAEKTAYFWGAIVPQPEPKPVPPVVPETPLYSVRVTSWATPSVNTRSEPRVAKETDIGDAFPGQCMDIFEEREVAGALWLRTNKGWIMAMYTERLPSVLPGMLVVPNYSQNNLRWKNNRLGSGKTTLGQEGCLVTITAAGMTYFGHYETPASLDEKLTNRGGYANGNQFYWNMPAILYGDVLKTEDQSFAGGVGFEKELSRILSEKRPVWAMVDWNPATRTFDQHWALVIGEVDGVFYLMDSWDGTVQALHAKYKKIYRIVGYTKS